MKGAGKSIGQTEAARCTAAEGAIFEHEEPAIALRRDAVQTSKLLVHAVELLQSEIDLLARRIAEAWSSTDEKLVALEQLQELRHLLQTTRIRCLALSSLKPRID